MTRLPLTTETQLHELMLDRIKIASQIPVAGSLLRESALDVSETLGFITDELVFNLSSYVLGHKLVDVHKSFVVTSPATWWDHAKADLAERWSKFRLVRWWLRRHPIREHSKAISVDFTEHATFPQCSVAYPKNLGPVHILQRIGATVDGEWTRQGEPHRIWPHEQAIADAAVKALAEIAKASPHDRAGLGVAGAIDEAGIPAEIAGPLYARVMKQMREARDA